MSLSLSLSFCALLCLSVILYFCLSASLYYLFTCCCLCVCLSFNITFCYPFQIFLNFSILHFFCIFLYFPLFQRRYSSPNSYQYFLFYFKFGHVLGFFFRETTCAKEQVRKKERKRERERERERLKSVCGCVSMFWKSMYGVCEREV
jgi:hypothetical protein